MLQKEKNYDFRKKMLAVHEKDIRNYQLKPAANQLEIQNNVTVIVPNDSDVILTAARDFTNYLFTSMGICAAIAKKGTPVTGQYVAVELAAENGVDMGKANGYKGFRIDVSDNILITGFDERGVAQGLYHLEEMMTLKKAPFITKETVFRKPMFAPQMVHSGYGLDEYPDEHLQAIAHEGRDAILVFVKDVNITPYGYLDFNELIHRARKYGIDVYAYSYLQSGKHPSDPGAESYYENNYGRLFATCPELKGIILVGESVGFPSHDPHVAPDPKSVVDKDGLPVGKPRSGWYPCEDFPEWLTLIQKIITKYNPDADIVFWTYNWNKQPEEARVKLIENIPEGITLQVNRFECGNKVHLEGREIITADYSIHYPGPTPIVASECIAAKKRDLRLYTMTNTGGLTWDFGTIPYVPAPFQWMRRYEGMKMANREWGLSGIMESHHYGMYPSFISKLSKWCFNDPDRDMEEILDDVLISEFGEECKDRVKDALNDWSDAITHYTPTDNDQYGAFRIGPSYPFVFIAPYKNPGMPYAHFGNRIYHQNYLQMYPHEVTGYRGAPVPIRVGAEIRSLEKMLAKMEAGIAKMNALETKNDKLLQLINLGQYMANTIKTGIASKKWYKLVGQFTCSETKEEVLDVLDRMEQLLLAEIENAEATIPLVEVDSRLGWEPSMEYMGDKARIEWKIRHTKYLINTEIGNQKRSALLGGEV